MSASLRVAGFAVMAALLAMTLRAAHERAGAAVAIAAGLMLAVAAVEKLSPVAGLLEELSRKAGVGKDTVGLLIRLVGMAYLTEFSFQICRDAGEEGIGAKAALCGKALILLETLPLLREIGEMALSLAP